MRVSCGVVLAGLLASAPAQAQSSGDGFLFRPPAGVFTFRVGYDRAGAGSDIFSFVTQELTVGRGDFSGAVFAADFTYRATPRVDIVVFSLSGSRAITPSEFRGFVDNNRQPIQQTTRFIRVPITASMKTYLTEPGRAIGRLAWIPARVAPYVGVGGGAMWYRFHQEGDFIDFNTTRVFGDTFDSTGWAPAVQAFGGAEISFSPRLALASEVKYQWARARMSSDFARFDPIDLSGVSVTTGISVRY